MSGRLHGSRASGLLLPALFALGGAGGAWRRASRRRQELPAAQQEELQMARVRALVAAAMRRAPYYRRAYAAAGVDPAALTDVAAFARLPLLEKDALRARPASDFLIARPRLARRSVTAGSTGKPVVVVQDLRWWARALARRDALYREHGFFLGAREARFWGRGARPARTGVPQRLGNRRVFQFLGATEAELAAELDDLRRFRPDYVYGYASLILAAARLAGSSRPLVPGLRAVVATAETLTGTQRALLREAFGCPVLNEYGCSEMDVIAFDCPHGACHVLSDHVLLEGLDDGAGGVEAVVTDLDNDVMPLIRYRLGDDVELAPGPCPCGRRSPILAAVRGRTVHRLVRLPDGGRAHAVCFAYLLEDLARRGHPYAQFRVHQDDPAALRYLIAGTPPPARAALARAIVEETARRLSPAMRVTVEFGEIPRTPGGKHTYFVPAPDAAD